METEIILCPHCSTPFTKEMVNVYNSTYGCETGCEHWYIDLDCEKCGKAVYRKNGEFGELTKEEIMEITEETWQEIIKNNPSHL